MPDVSAQQRQVLLTTAQAGALLELSAERIRQLINAGYIEKHGKDQVPLVSAVRGYVRFLKDDERKVSRTAAVSRVQIARAREIELKIAEREHRLIDIAEHEDLFAEAFGSIRSGLAGVPARVTRDVGLRRQIEAGIDDVLRRAADRFEEGTANLKASGADIAPSERDDA